MPMQNELVKLKLIILTVRLYKLRLVKFNNCPKPAERFNDNIATDSNCTSSFKM